MSITLHSVDLRVHSLRTRLPFRYGIVTVRAFPHLMMSADVEVNGQRQRGFAADHLPPKWFTKNPDSHYRDDLTDMTACIRAAAQHGMAAGAHASVFGWWLDTYTRQKRWARNKPHPPLLWNFGVTLMERAVIDAFCRSSRTTLADALRFNSLGIDLGAFPEGSNIAGRFVPPAPLKSILARHTVGLIDPLTAADIAPADRVDDGLPQALDDCIRVYGLKHFKIKLSGDVERDAARLRKLAGLLDRVAGKDYACTLDANENFSDIVPFKQLWLSLAADDSLKDFLGRLLFVEQPLHRDAALTPAVKAALAAWPEHPPMIIDESDGEFASLPAALGCGYNGTSHKNCKGVFKSIRNYALLKSLREQHPDRSYLLSGEDLSNVGPVALLQDLTVASALGIESIERNAQHYFRGMSAFEPALQGQMLAAHGDLFRRHEQGFATLDIRDGRVKLESVNRAPFGVAIEPDLSAFTPLDEWKFESLGIE